MSIANFTPSRAAADIHMAMVIRGGIQSFGEDGKSPPSKRYGGSGTRKKEKRRGGRRRIDSLLRV